MFKLTGSEKAFLGGFVAALGTTLVQVVQSKELTWQEAGWSLLVWVLTHATVWLATNSPADTSAPAIAPAQPAPGATVAPQDTPAQ